MTCLATEALQRLSCNKADGFCSVLQECCPRKEVYFRMSRNQKDWIGNRLLDHSVWRGFDILDSRSAKMLNLSGMWLTNRAIPLCVHHNRVFHTNIQSLENVYSLVCWSTTPPIMTVLLTITYWASLSARDTVLRGHWYGVQTPWNESPFGSRCAPS